jgi:hypothetical protein
MVTRKILWTIFVLSCITATRFGQTIPASKDGRDSLIVRLKPSVFKSLPPPIVIYLESNGYTIPQCWSDSLPNNVVIGSFTRRGQRDWAVLASRRGKSRILVFWKSSPHQPDALEERPDANFVQDVGGGVRGYSRLITTATKKAIAPNSVANDGTRIRSADHDGIDDACVEKASTVHYYFRGKWLHFTGAD